MNKIGTIFLVVGIVYMIIAIPLAVVSQEITGDCKLACINFDEGFDIVSSTQWINVEEVKCGCYSRFTRENVLISIEKGGR